LETTDTKATAAGKASIKKIFLIKIIIIVCLCFAILDFGYKTINNINFANKQQCIVYRMLPRPGFILFENLVDLPVLIF
jgi:hypothetical protein